MQTGDGWIQHDGWSSRTWRNGERWLSLPDEWTENPDVAAGLVQLAAGYVPPVFEPMTPVTMVAVNDDGVLMAISGRYVSPGEVEVRRYQKICFSPELRIVSIAKGARKRGLEAAMKPIFAVMEACSPLEPDRRVAVE